MGFTRMNLIEDRIVDKLKSIRDFNIFEEVSFENSSNFTIMHFEIHKDFPIYIEVDPMATPESACYWRYRHKPLDKNMLEIYPNIQTVLQELKKRDMNTFVKKILFNLDFFKKIEFYPRYLRGFTVNFSYLDEVNFDDISL